MNKRDRAIEAFLEKIDSWDDEPLDDLIRKTLGIIPRPEGIEPYGWLLPQTSEYSPMSVSEAGIKFIKLHEGFRGTAYLDPVGVWTIGYGHTHGVIRGLTMTESEASELLKQEVNYYADAVKRLVTVPLTQKQFDALTSFTYNLGVGAFSQSTLLKLLNQRQYQGAAHQFSRWVYGAGQVLPGLVTRRQQEQELFLS